MKPSRQPNDEYPYQPPPVYSPPGQEPSSQIRMEPKNFSPSPSAPPPPGLYTPQTQQPQPMIIYANTVNTPVSFGPYPMRFTCPNCNAHVMTETESTPGLLTYILSGALCFIAGYIPCCCLIPCCIRECKDIEHKCPNCRNKLGLFKRI